MDIDSAARAETERVPFLIGGLRIEPVSDPSSEPVDAPFLGLEMEIKRYGPVVRVAADAELQGLIEPGRPKKGEEADFSIGQVLS
jgi:hypothetical protein